jgi:predicted DNA-binding transcriptional regulator AlpA
MAVSVPAKVNALSKQVSRLYTFRQHEETIMIEMVTKAEVATQLGISERKLEMMVKECRFPPPIRLGKQAKWSRSNVERWQEQLLLSQDAWFERNERRRK